MAESRFCTSEMWSISCAAMWKMCLRKRWTASASEAYRSFFFQAEDGIRDADVTGVQTRALPICVYKMGTSYFLSDILVAVAGTGWASLQHTMFRTCSADPRTSAGFMMTPPALHRSMSNDIRSEERRLG